MNKKKIIILLFFLLPLLIVGLFLYKASYVLTIVGGGGDKKDVYADFHVEPEDNRINMLILGIRGAGDENGGLLADTIILLSFDKEEEKASLVSLPRDLYVEMPQYPKREKLNFAYALGEERRWGGGGLDFSKQVVQYVTGVYVDYAAVVNFEGFVRIVDLLGGVQVHLAYDFVESEQWQGEGRDDSEFWHLKTAHDEEETSQDDPEAFDGAVEEETTEGENEEPAQSPRGIEAGSPQSEGLDGEYWVFHIPEGTHTLDGEDALYYVRSRFSSSDFDRMKRQQQVVSSLKAKVLSFGLLSNPVKVFNLIDALGNNIRTDMGLGDMREALSLAQKYSSASVKIVSLDIFEGGVLKADYIDGQYVIVPKGGDFGEVRRFFQDIFYDEE